MFKQSDEPRFAKKRAALQRAFIDLTLEHRSTRLTVKEIAERAGVNRMTFYSHYDEVPDILAEFLDGLARKIMASCEGTAEMGVRRLLKSATDCMQAEVEFYRLVACEDGFESYRSAFRDAFTAIFANELCWTTELEGPHLDLVAGMVASGVTNAYLDWLAGQYANLPLDELVSICEGFALNARSLVITLPSEGEDSTRP